MLKQMSRMIRDDAIGITLWQDMQIYGVRSNVQWKPGPGSIMDFREARLA
jgi:hypothetical protein